MSSQDNDITAQLILRWHDTLFQKQISIMQEILEETMYNRIWGKQSMFYGLMFQRKCMV